MDTEAEGVPATSPPQPGPSADVPTGMETDDNLTYAHALEELRPLPQIQCSNHPTKPIKKRKLGYAKLLTSTLEEMKAQEASKPKRTKKANQKKRNIPKQGKSMTSVCGNTTSEEENVDNILQSSSDSEVDVTEETVLEVADKEPEIGDFILVKLKTVSFKIVVRSSTLVK